MNTVNNSELASRIADKHPGITVEVAADTITALLEEVQAAVAAGEKVSLWGFGAFEGRQKAARKGRNPHTGETLDIPPMTAPAFKASVKFKELVKDAAKA